MTCGVINPFLSEVLKRHLIFKTAKPPQASTRNNTISASVNFYVAFYFCCWIYLMNGKQTFNENIMYY